MTSRAPWWTASPARAACIAAAVAVLAHLNALGNGFAYDDVHIVVNDDALASLSSLPERLARPWWPEAGAGAGRELGLWRPVSTAALALQRAVVGLEPLLFHAVNVGLHAIATVLVTLIAGTLVGVPAALAGGLVFAVHPVHVEAVANVVGVSELLGATFYLAACLLFLRRTPLAAAVEGAYAKIGGRTVAALCGLYAMAMLSKESAVTLPAALVLLDLTRRPVHLRRLRGWVAERAGLLVAMGGTLAVVLVLRVVVLGSIASSRPPLGAHLLDEIPRIWTLGVIWFESLRLLAVPLSLSVDYSPDVIPILTVWTPRAIAGVGLALALLFASWYAWRRTVGGGGSGEGLVPIGRLPALALLWFVVTIAPASNVFFLSGILLAERTLYLPSAGFAIVVGAGAAALFRRRRLAALALATGVLTLFAVRSWTRTSTWKSTETVLTTLVRDRPEAGRALWLLGDMLAQQGERETASAAYREAVGRLDSAYWLLRALGWDAVEREDYRLGEYLLRQAREQRPDEPSAWRRLAILYTRQGRHGDAAEAARGTVLRSPGDVVGWHLLASSSTALGTWGEAIEARTRVIELGEDPWQQWLPLARLYLTVGDSARAREAYAEALRRAEGEGERRVVETGFAPFDPPSAVDSVGDPPPL